MSRQKPVPVVDIFAGPGGLGEGFSSLHGKTGERSFRITISIEKDPVAHRTLLLRSFFRQFDSGDAPADYYNFLRAGNVMQDQRWHLLKEKFPKQTQAAESEARNAELGKNKPDEVDSWIRGALKGADAWVLIGGPPCQAYSIAGRSRNNGIPDYVPEEDERQYLYGEYLRILATHLPPVFIMENVKGLLSATLQSESILEKILSDLRQPRVAIKNYRGNKSARYRIFSLVKHGESETLNLDDFVVKAEKYGIPQARHRVILLGVRDDIDVIQPNVLRPQDPVTVHDILHSLPALRSGLSEEIDDSTRWRSIVAAAPWRQLLKGIHDVDTQPLQHLAQTSLAKLQRKTLDRGGEFLHGQQEIRRDASWYLDRKLDGVCNHTSRSHIAADLHRYFYASIFAKVTSRSPTLSDFPRKLLPKHNNVQEALDGGHFSDRFRVQLANRPATTITSHISKDGHYYIHYDPVQCRSLTVREAARLQTFPDNYFFCGPRTSQYAQVGNAVPPLLARQIAEVVLEVLRKAGAG